MKKYKIIYADLPWQVMAGSKQGRKEGDSQKSLKLTYPTMELEEIKNLQKDKEEQLAIQLVSHCFDKEELNLIRQWFNNFIDGHPDNVVTKKEWNIGLKIHNRLDMEPENRIVKNCG